MPNYERKFRPFFQRMDHAWQSFDDEESRVELLRHARNFVEFNRDFVMQYPLIDDWNGKDPASVDEAEFYRPFSGKELGLYFHIPFCQTRCTYCNFHIVAGAKSVAEFERAYLEKLEEEVGRILPFVSDFSVRTIFVGGGTPSFLSLSGMAKLLSIISKVTSGRLLPDTEFTFEGNPDSFDSRKFRMLKESGVNRISLGIQTFDEAIIAKINRTYTERRVLDCVAEARAAGFSELNIDMMYGLPGQTIDTMRSDLAKALSIGAEHLTYYPLYHYESSVLGKTRHADDSEKEAVLDSVYEFYGEIRSAAKTRGYWGYGREYYSKGEGHTHKYQNDYVAGVPLLGFGHSSYSFNGGRVFVKDSNFSNYMAADPPGGIVAYHDY